jgi:hypothetical protein
MERSPSPVHLEHNLLINMPRPPMQYVRNVQSIDCLDFSGETKYNDWRDDLVRDGYAVVPAISAEKAAQYVERFHDWLEDL